MKELIDFICSAFFVYFTADAGFKVALRKKEQSGKRLPVYTQLDFSSFFHAHCLTDEQGIALTKRILDLELEAYSKLLK